VKRDLNKVIVSQIPSIIKYSYNVSYAVLRNAHITRIALHAMNHVHAKGLYVIPRDSPEFSTFLKRIGAKRPISLPSSNISALDTRGRPSSFTRVSCEHHARAASYSRSVPRAVSRRPQKKESSAASIERRGPRLAVDSQLRRERTCRAQNPTERRRRAAEALGGVPPARCGRAPPRRVRPCTLLGVRVPRRPCGRNLLSLSLPRARARARARSPFASPRHARREAPDGAAAGRFPGARFARGGASSPDSSNRVSFSLLFLSSSFIPARVTRASLAARRRVIPAHLQLASLPMNFSYAACMPRRD